MCGRFTRRYTWQEVHEGLSLLDGAPNFAASYNVAPTQSSLIARYDSTAGGRVAALARWGLLPAWAKDIDVGARAFNARAETLAERPMFRSAFASRRCLVPVSEFYEWRKPDRQPFAFGAAGGVVLALAGLWELWTSPAGETVRSFTIVTTEANVTMAPIHNRMPVVLAPDAWSAWLGEATVAPAQLAALLRPCPPEALTMWPVSRRVGNVREDDPGLVERVA